MADKRVETISHVNALLVVIKVVVVVVVVRELKGICCFGFGLVLGPQISHTHSILYLPTTNKKRPRWKRKELFASQVQ